MMTGVVQFFLEDKGYGYIRVLETREEFFVPRRELRQPIERGMRVQFRLRENKQGFYAAEVSAIAGAQ